MKSSLPFLAALLGASVSEVAAFRPRRNRRTSSPHNSIANIPRGGGGPLDPDVASKLFVGAFGANAAMCAVTPKAAMKLYGNEDANDSDAWLVSSSGAIGATTSLLLYLTKMKGMAFDEAIGYSTLPYVITKLGHLVLGYDKHVDMPAKSHVVDTLNNLLVLGFSLAGKPASILNHLYGVFSLLNAALFYGNPDGASKAFEFSLAGSPVLGPFLTKTIGYFLLGHGVAVCSKGNVGLTSLATALPLLALIVGGDFDTAQMPAAPALVWVAVLGAIASSLLL